MPNFSCHFLIEVAVNCLNNLAVGFGGGNWWSTSRPKKLNLLMVRSNLSAIHPSFYRWHNWNHSVIILENDENDEIIDQWFEMLSSESLNDFYSVENVANGNNTRRWFQFA